jgi:lipopolysaccharide export system protein LptA
MKGDLRLTADRVELRLAPQAGAASAPGGGSTFGGRTVRSLHAVGHVTVEQGARRATSKEAFYDQAQDTITLTGEPVAWEKDYRVAGTKMTLFLKDNRSIVEDSRLLIKPRTGGGGTPADSRGRRPPVPPGAARSGSE